MKYRRWFLLILFPLLMVGEGFSRERKDVVKTSQGKLIIGLLNHASVQFQYQGITIYCDPVFSGQTSLPKADIILISHAHYDHFNLNTIEAISTSSTQIIYTEECAQKLDGGTILKNGDKITLSGIGIEAVPAYNLNPRFNENSAYHPKGVGNGYLISFDEVIVYLAGDTDLIPEMDQLPKIDIAFLPIMAPYTMGKKEFVETVKIIQPRRVYPYHTGITDLKDLSELLISETNIELIIP